MLNVTSLMGRPSESDWLRYGRGTTPAATGPVVVWNCTRTCNLACLHCYSDSHAQKYDQLTTDEALAMIGDIAGMGSPAMLFSGGEPLVRDDLLDLMAAARAAGLNVTLSSNGTLITDAVAAQLADIGVRYVGISLDGIGAVHDSFRGRRGAFDAALDGIRSLKAAGVKVGVRITLSPSSIASLDELFDLVEDEGLDRVCCYHMVPAGRGQSHGLLPVEESRAAVERVFDRAEQWVADDRPIEMLTVDNYADGPALVMRLARTDRARAEAAAAALSRNGGQRGAGGRRLAAVDWVGTVRPDQFWGGTPLGSVRTTPLSEIWQRATPLLSRLRNRSEQLGSRCADCAFRDMCGGGLTSRVLACGLALHEGDPSCHLTDAEIAGVAA